MLARTRPPKAGTRSAAPRDHPKKSRSRGGLQMTLGDFGPSARRLERNVTLPERASLAGFADLLVGHRQVEVGVGELRVGLDGAVKQRHAELRLAALEHDVAQVVLRFGLASVDF